MLFLAFDYQRAWRRLILMALLCFAPLSLAKPLAKQGVIDLSTFDLAHGKTAELNGEWDFFPGKLLVPNDFSAGNAIPSSSMTVPALWDNTRMAGQPFATYRLRIRLAPGHHQLALRLGKIDTAYRIWIDGVEKASNGLPASTAQAGRDAKEKIQIVRFENQGQIADLLIQTASFKWNSGGIYPAIHIGQAEDISQQQSRRWAIALAVVGALVVLGIYHLAIFANARSNIAACMLGTYCLLRASNAVFSGASDWVSSLLFPQLPPLIPYVTGMASLAISIPLLQTFFYLLFPRQFRLNGLIFFVTAGAVCTLAGIYSQFLPKSITLLLYAYMLLALFYSVTGLWQARQAKAQGASILLAGYALIGLTGINDILNANKVIQTIWLTPLGTLGFILSQAFVLARRFSSAFASTEALSITLEASNAALHAEMAERARLEYEIGQVAEEERRAISRALHDGLCQELTAARLHCSLLQKPGTTTDAHEHAKLSALLGRAVDLAYELSRGLWPVELNARGLMFALNELADEFRHAHGLDITVVSAMSCHCCDHLAATQVFHIAKEALQNITKHAQARHVHIDLDCLPDHQGAHLLIEDDGIGFNSDKRNNAGLGTRIMAHRARIIGGTLTIEEKPEGGTRVNLIIPCKNDKHPDRPIASIQVRKESYKEKV